MKHPWAARRLWICVAYIFISEKELETLLNAVFSGTADHDFDH